MAAIVASITMLGLPARASRGSRWRVSSAAATSFGPDLVRCWYNFMRPHRRFPSRSVEPEVLLEA